MPKNWKYIKKLLEKEFLCEKLKGHITYDLTDYRPAPWYQQHFIMKYDDEVLLCASQPDRKWDKRHPYQHTYWKQRDVIAEKLREKYDLSEEQLADVVEDTIEEVDRINAHYDGVFGVKDIVDLIGEYLHSDIEASLGYRQDYFINALAVLDRRCGKRRLEKLAKTDCAGFPEWLRRICRIRFEAEGVSYNKYFDIARI